MATTQQKINKIFNKAGHRSNLLDLTGQDLAVMLHEKISPVATDKNRFQHRDTSNIVKEMVKLTGEKGFASKDKGKFKPKDFERAVNKIFENQEIRPGAKFEKQFLEGVKQSISGADNKPIDQPSARRTGFFDWLKGGVGKPSGERFKTIKANQIQTGSENDSTAINNKSIQENIRRAGGSHLPQEIASSGKLSSENSEPRVNTGLPHARRFTEINQEDQD